MCRSSCHRQRQPLIVTAMRAFRTRVNGNQVGLSQAASIEPLPQQQAQYHGPMTGRGLPIQTSIPLAEGQPPAYADVTGKGQVVVTGASLGDIEKEFAEMEKRHGMERAEVVGRMMEGKY